MNLQPAQSAALVVTLACALGLFVWLDADAWYFLLGILGAVFANSTGAGGGVVFIPAFAQAGLSAAQSVSTSFGIQCFGMVAGSISWLLYRRGLPSSERAEWQAFVPALALSTVAAVVGIWTNYGLELSPPASLRAMFKLFSALLGAGIMLTVIFGGRRTLRFKLEFIDALVLLIVAWFGSIITGWLSVSAGEFVAFYLIARRYNIAMSIAIAVVLTAITVWSVAPIHLASTSPIAWHILVYAAPGAIVGGFFARFLAIWLPPYGLKLFFGFWLLMIGLFG